MYFSVNLHDHHFIYIVETVILELHSSNDIIQPLQGSSVIDILDL